MAIAFVAAVKAHGTSTSIITVTSGAINTAGANLLVASLYGDTSSTPVVTDNYGNTWTLAVQNLQSAQASYVFYSQSPNVGSGHTFTVSSLTYIYIQFQVMAFSGALTTANPKDVTNSNSTIATTIQPGSVTPTGNGQLVFSGLFDALGTTATINSSFTSPAGAGTGYGDVGSNNVWEGGFCAYLIQTTAAAVNPTWTTSPSATLIATIATFKPAGAGGGTGGFKLGTSAVTALKKGSTAVTKLMQGTVQVWPSGGSLAAPGVPTAVGGTSDDAKVEVVWTAPTSNGGSSITDYVIERAPSPAATPWTAFSHTAFVIPTAITVTGLTNGQAYLFRVSATNGVGTSSPSTASAPVTPLAPAGVIFRSIGTLQTGGGTLTVDKPSGVASGDLLLICCHSDDANALACTGFTSVGSATYTGAGSASRRDNFLWKIAGGSEPSTYSVTGGGSNYNEAICLAYTGATGVGAVGSTNGNFNSPALTVAANGSNEVILWSFDNGSNNASAPAGWTRRLNGASAYNLWIAGRPVSAGTTTSSNFTGVGDTAFGYGSISIILTP